MHPIRIGGTLLTASEIPHFGLSSPLPRGDSLPPGSLRPRTPSRSMLGVPFCSSQLRLLPCCDLCCAPRGARRPDSCT
eukprot:6173215-Pleurochrysis_carterae.AAC.5